MDNTTGTMTRWVKVATIALIWCCCALARQNIRLVKEVKQATALTDRCIDVAEWEANAIDWREQNVCE